MPVYEKTTGGEVYLRGIDRRVARGDRVDADAGFAEYLEERGDFRALDVQDAEFREVDADAAAEQEPDSTASEGFDVDAWLDQDYQTRADRVLEGDVDGHLDTIDEAETSDTVRDAVGERRAELEAEG